MTTADAEVAIRIPSTAALFDAWSVEPLGSRPLSDEARERIVDAWSEVAKKGTGTPRLELVLPLAERAGTDEAELVGAVRADMRTMRVDARRHWIRRALLPRETRIGVLLTPASFRLGRRYFAELAEAEITLRWD